MEGVIWPEVARYLTLTITEEELKTRGLTDVCWTRKAARGAHPGITTPEVDIPLSEPILDTDSKLLPPKHQPTAGQRAGMLGLMFVTTTRTAMTTHTYTFRGSTYLQEGGGPIGNPLSSAVARAVIGLGPEVPQQDCCTGCCTTSHPLQDLHQICGQPAGQAPGHPQGLQVRPTSWGPCLQPWGWAGGIRDGGWREDDVSAANCS